MNLLKVSLLLTATIIFPPWLPHDLLWELQRLYERPPVITVPVVTPLPTAIVFLPCLPDDCLEFIHALELQSAIVTPAAVPLPVTTATELHFILPTGHTHVSGWYFHDSRFPADGPQHTGLDYACAQGDPIYAAASGTVTAARWNDNFGHQVIIHHSAGWITYYGHLSGYASRGYVQQGAIIGFCGDTGLSTGPHLHFEVHHAGLPVDPATLP